MPKEDRSDEILDAAAGVFARYGYDKATMDDIGKLVGMNKVSLYYYFDGKEALFKAALGREARLYDERCLEAARMERGCRARIETWIARVFRYSQESGLLRSVSSEALTALSPLLREYRHSSFASAAATVASFLDEGKKSGEIRRGCESGKAAEAIVGLAFSMKGAAYRERGGEVDLEALIGRILYAVGLMLDGLAASPAAAKKASQGKRPAARGSSRP